MNFKAPVAILAVGFMVLCHGEASADSSKLKLNQEIIDSSPVLRRWLEKPPDVLFDIFQSPSFSSKIRLGLTARDQSLGFEVGVADLFLGGSAFTLSAAYQREFSGLESDLSADLKYYVLPLGGYFNVAPQVGYRSIEFFGENVSGLEVGLVGVLVLSPRSADVRLSQTFTAPSSDRETSITTLSTSYAITQRFNLGTMIQWRRSPVRGDSRVGFYLESRF